MVEDYDLVIRNASLRGREGLFDIAVRSGVIEEVGRVSGRGAVEIDAGKGLVTEAFTNPHLHMCKVYTYLMIGEEAVRHYQASGMGGAMAAIEIASKVKERYGEGWIYRNARRAAMEAVANGTLYIRAFADTDTKAGLEGVKALLRLKDELGDFITIQVVAFPQDGVVRDPGAEEYVRKAVEMGADVVGGIPWIEYTEEDEWEHINRVFAIAKEFNRDVAMLTDDAGDPSLRTTEKLARKAVKEGWVGRVTACHARAMSTYPEPYLRKVASLIRMAGLSLVTDPHTGPLHLPVKFMLSQGVNVALGQDDIADAYYPYGRNNMLEVAFLASHILWSMTLSDMDTFLDMITWRGARAMGLRNYGVRVGSVADLLVHRYRTPYELVWRHEPPRYVVRRGRVLVENVGGPKYGDPRLGLNSSP